MEQRPNALTGFTLTIKALLHILFSILPFLISVALFHLVANGMVNFGGGCKDIILVYPCFVVSVIYFVSYWVAVYKKVKILKAVLVSLILSATLFIAGYFVIYFTYYHFFYKR